MRKNILVSVSSLPAEKEIFDYVKKIESSADFLHCDIMDGTVTPATSILNHIMVREINDRSTLPLDIHLMVRSPQKYVDKFIKSYANIITVHREYFDNDSQVIETIKKIQKNKMIAGVAVDLPTDVKILDPILAYCDLVLVMSVDIGASGQKFDESAVEKVKYLANIRKEKGYKFLIEVDGGINNQNCSKLTKNGADILVSGSYVFNDTNSQQAIASLKKYFIKK